MPAAGEADAIGVGGAVGSGTAIVGDATGVGVATSSGRSGTTTRGTDVGRGTGAMRTVGTTRGGCAGAVTTGARGVAVGVGAGVGRGAVAPVVGSESGGTRGVGRDAGRLNPSSPGIGVAGADVCALAADATNNRTEGIETVLTVFTCAAIALFPAAPSHRDRASAQRCRTRGVTHPHKR